MVLTVLNSFLGQSSLVSTNVTSTLKVFLNDMCYINARFTYLPVNMNSGIMQAIVYNLSE